MCVRMVDSDTRRRYLQLLTAGLSTTVAGCSSVLDADGPGSDPTTTATDDAPEKIDDWQYDPPERGGGGGSLLPLGSSSSGVALSSAQSGSSAGGDVGLAAGGAQDTTTFRRNIENELPADTEQCPPDVLALGLDQADFLAAMAPKPAVIMGKQQDFFDVRGTREAYRRLQHLYGLLGKRENIRLFVGPGPHGYSRENREAMYRLFNDVTGISDATEEPDITIEEDSDLWCAPDGQVCRLDSRTVHSFTKAKSRRLAEERSSDLSGPELKSHIIHVLGLRELANASIDAQAETGLAMTVESAKRAKDNSISSVKSMSSVRTVYPGGSLWKGCRGNMPDYRILQVWLSRDYPKRHATTYMVKTEPGIHAVVYRLSDRRLRQPPREKTRAVLYVSHKSSDAELRDEPLIGTLMKKEPDAAFYTCDVRGIGESRPDTTNRSWLHPYGADFFYAAHSIMLSTPALGQRTWDVLRVLDWLNGIGHEEVHLVGKGWGALPATFAALLSDRVTQVTLKHPLTSYSDVAESETYEWPLSCLLPGVLEEFDLRACYEALQEKELRQIEPWGPDMQVVGEYEE